MKIWVDDIRLPPGAEWNCWAKTSAEAIWCLKVAKDIFDKSGTDLNIVEAMSLDHDLGNDDTTRPVVLWMCENDFWPVEVVVHSANPVGRDYLEGMIERYKS